MYCVKCGSLNDDSARFCIRCGTRIVHPKPAPSPPQPRPPEQGQRLRPAPVATDFPPPPLEPARPQTMRRLIVSCAVVALVLVLLCGLGLVAAYYWLGQPKDSQAAQIVSADTPVLISVGPDARQASHVLDFDSLEMLLPIFGVVPELRRVAESVQSSPLVDLSLDPRTDLLPWMGAEANVIVLDVDATGYRGVPPTILTVAARNEEKAWLFLERMQAELEQEGLEFEEEVYRDTRIVYQVSQYDGAFAPAFALIEQMVVVGTDREALHQVIDGVQTSGEATLADRRQYQAVLDALPRNRLGYVYLDGPTVAASLGSEASLPIEEEALQGIGISFGLETDGVRLDYVVQFDPEILEQAGRRAVQRPPHRPDSAGLAPDEAVIFWSGQDLQVGWEMLGSFLEDPQEFEELLLEMEQETGVHLVDDILAHTAGECGLAVVPARSGLFGMDELPVDLLVAARTQDTRALESSLDQLVEVLEEEASLEIGSQTIGDISFRMVADPDAGWELGYGFEDDLLIAGTSQGVLRDAMPGPGGSLSDATIFGATMRPLPSEAHNYLFLDLQEIVDVARDAMSERDREFFDRDVRPYLAPIRAIGLSTVWIEDEGMQRGTLFLYSGGD